MAIMGSKPAFDAVIFDIDNVLIDTRRSYLEAVRWTVEIFLTEGKIPYFVYRKKTREPQILAPEDVDEFKLLGGFNDDWDCCYGLLVYLLSLPVRGRQVEDLKKAIDIPSFAKGVTYRPLLVRGIVKRLGRPPDVTIEKISRIFQEIYLGTGLFKKVHLRDPVYWFKRGLLNKEKLIFRKSTLEKLKRMGVKLGIATGRSRFEATFALKRFGLLEVFNAITTVGEVKRAEQAAKQSLRKPHPYSLICTAEKLGVKKRLLYVGDLPDDVLAVRRAKKELEIWSVFYPWFSCDEKKVPDQIRHLAPDFVLETPGDLPRLVHSPRSFAP